ncbi:IS4 family transposase, partial [Parasediminibacterium sp. JCM 36343]|uniref:IS4 family transposase n=1 Tax=Parasediminibacterium sp. JCM 36343 TaxID=3374279 RepID=UPI00397D51B6
TRRARGKQTKSPYGCRFNSIRDRICTIDEVYFERLLEEIFLIYNKELKEEKALSKVDSTFVALAASLFSIGMENGDGNSKRFVKYSIVLKGSLPCKAKVFTEQPYVSEELALAEAINDTGHLCDDIVVFDRGMQSRNSFDKFTGDNKYFVTRGKVGISCQLPQIQEVAKKPDHSTVTITGDEIGFLVNRQKKKTSHKYRVIKGVMDASGQEICFVTNLLDMDAYTIARLYKERWEIELFFKFIKQHLNTTHLVSRDENGIKVMLYMTMILATLIIVYKKTNKIKGFKMAKVALEIELDNEMIKAIVRLCGGDP